MLTLLLASLAPLPAPVAAAPLTPAPWTQDEGSGDAEFDGKLTAAGDDVEALWTLHEESRAGGRRDLSKIALKKIIEVAPDHEEARKALGHRRYDDQWFESYSALSKYRREEEKRKLEEEGVVRYNDGWAKPEDIPFLRMGWTKDEATSEWVNPAIQAAKDQDAKLRADGWEQRVDMTWYSPDEAAKVEENLWKCGEEWLDLEKANEFHSQPYQWWAEKGDHFIALGTVPRAADGSGRIEWSRWWADQTWDELVRALGVKPDQPPTFVVLGNLDQYNAFAAGSQELGLPQTEGTGASSVHYSYFADSMFDPRTQPPTYQGQGVCYWDYANPDMYYFGEYAVRHAAAHSYMERIDPSWNTISEAFDNPNGLQAANFWAEKRIPKWLRYGIAAHCERFMKNPAPAEGADPFANRAWALKNLRAGGELGSLEDVFAMNIDPADITGSLRRIFVAGLLVSFMLDGENEAVREAHAAFKAAMVSGADTSEAAAALQKALTDNQEALKAYAKM